MFLRLSNLGPPEPGEQKSRTARSTKYHRYYLFCDADLLNRVIALCTHVHYGSIPGPESEAKAKRGLFGGRAGGSGGHEQRKSNFALGTGSLLRARRFRPKDTLAALAPGGAAAALLTVFVAADATTKERSLAATPTAPPPQLDPPPRRGDEPPDEVADLAVAVLSIRRACAGHLAQLSEAEQARVPLVLSRAVAAALQARALCVRRRASEATPSGREGPASDARSPSRTSQMLPPEREDKQAEEEEVALVNEVAELITAFESCSGLVAAVYDALLLNLPLWAAASPPAHRRLLAAITKLSSARKPSLQAYWHQPTRALQAAQRVLDQAALVYRADDTDSTGSLGGSTAGPTEASGEIAGPVGSSTGGFDGVGVTGVGVTDRVAVTTVQGSEARALFDEALKVVQHLAVSVGPEERGCASTSPADIAAMLLNFIARSPHKHQVASALHALCRTLHCPPARVDSADLNRAAPLQSEAFLDALLAANLAPLLMYLLWREGQPDGTTGAGAVSKSRVVMGCVKLMGALVAAGRLNENAAEAAVNGVRAVASRDHNER
eukprot:1196123-Prorocentrum_minimum.AAC.3